MLKETGFPLGYLILWINESTEFDRIIKNPIEGIYNQCSAIYALTG